MATVPHPATDEVWVSPTPILGEISHLCADGHHERCGGVVGFGHVDRRGRWNGVTLRPCDCLTCLHRPTTAELASVARRLETP